MSLAEKIVPEEAWSEGQPWRPVPTPSRFRTPLSKFRVWRNESACIKCGKCVEVCPYGVHTKSGSYLRRPKSYRCLGLACQDKEFSASTSARSTPFGSASTRCTAPWGTSAGPPTCCSHLVAGGMGNLPYTDLEYRLGGSGGGFDKMRFLFPKHRPRISN